MATPPVCVIRYETGRLLSESVVTEDDVTFFTAEALAEAWVEDQVREQSRYEYVVYRAVTRFRNMPRTEYILDLWRAGD